MKKITFILPEEEQLNSWPERIRDKKEREGFYPEHTVEVSDDTRIPCVGEEVDFDESPFGDSIGGFYIVKSIYTPKFGSGDERIEIELTLEDSII